MAQSNQKIELMSAAQVRAYIKSQRGENESLYATVNRLVDELGISRRAIYNAQKNGVFAEVRRAGAVLYQHAVEQGVATDHLQPSARASLPASGGG